MVAPWHAVCPCMPVAQSVIPGLRLHELKAPGSPVEPGREGPQGRLPPGMYGQTIGIISLMRGNPEFRSGIRKEVCGSTRESIPPPRSPPRGAGARSPEPRPWSCTIQDESEPLRRLGPSGGARSGQFRKPEWKGAGKQRMGKILIIDDDHMMSKTLAYMIQSTGHEARCASTLGDGSRIVGEEPFDVVLLDVGMPDGSGLRAVQTIKESPSQPEVIIITAAGDPDGAELALRCGAWDYIEKTPSIKDLLPPLSRVLEYRKEKRAVKPPLVLKRERIVGGGPRIQECLQKIAQASSCEVNVLITGETGTGKELFARAIHENSDRADGNFVVVDCAALPSELVESLLFGHKKGAFTGASADQVGLVSQADGGTLFLDEVGELPSEMQKKFLRVLQERCFRPVGAKEEALSRFRVIAATNRDLDVMVNEGRFRKDLLYRLRALQIELPPLRDRREDTIDLARFHVGRLCDLYGSGAKGFSPDFLDALTSYPWPGNVRELVNVLDGAVALCGKGMTLFANHLPVQMRVHILKHSLGGKSGENTRPRGPEAGGSLPSMRDFREDVEREYLGRLIALSMNDVQEATRISGISKSRLYELFAKHRLSRTRRSSPHDA